jgi:hypothetical protein
MDERDLRLGREISRDARMYPATRMAAHCRARRRIQWQGIAPSSNGRDWLNQLPLRRGWTGSPHTSRKKRCSPQQPLTQLIRSLDLKHKRFNRFPLSVRAPSYPKTPCTEAPQQRITVVHRGSVELTVKFLCRVYFRPANRHPSKGSRTLWQSTGLPCATSRFVTVTFLNAIAGGGAGRSVADSAGAIKRALRVSFEARIVC